MADDHEGAGVAAQPAFQPVDRGDVEVVGRFIQQQQIGLAGERAGQRCTAAFPAAGTVRLAAHVDAKLAGDRLHLVAGRRVLAVQGKVHQRVIAGEERVLLQRHDPRARLDRALALVSLDLTRNQLQ